MGLLKKILVIVFLNAILMGQAFALKTDFETVRLFHDQEIDKLLKDYTLEDSLTVRAELKRKEGDLKKQQIVDIPGLYQKTGQAEDHDVESVLNLYDRKFVIIKKREIGEKEIELVKQALTERLYLPKETIFTTIDNMPRINDAVQNLKSDFVIGAYSTLIKNGQFLWILIFSIGFIIALWVLAKAWKTKSEGAAAAAAGGGGGGPGNFTLNGEFPAGMGGGNDSGGGQNMSISMTNSEFETFNFLSFCQNVNEAFDKAPGSTVYLMWKYLPDFQTQLQLYELIRIQAQVPEAIRDKSYAIMNSLFSFEKRAGMMTSNQKGAALSKDVLAIVSVELTKLKFIKPNEALEKSFSALYPDHADNQAYVFQKAMDHHVVLYKIFKDQFMNYLTTIKDDSILSKVNDLLTFDPETSHATDAQYNDFATFMAKLPAPTAEGGKETKNPVNAKITQMILGLSEADLFKIEAMNTNEELRSQIPCLTWIATEPLKQLKEFFSDLSGPEIKFLLDNDPKYNTALNTMDERAQFRFKERVNSEKDGVLNWREFRQKIGRHYQYQSAAGNAEQKAS